MTRLAKTLVETQQLFHCGCVCVGFFVVVVVYLLVSVAVFIGKQRGVVNEF